MVSTRIFRGCILLLAALLLGACQSSLNPAAAELETPTAAAAEALRTVRVGYIPIGSAAPILIAYEKGYFAELGLEVQLESFRTGGEMIAPLGLGQLDIGSGESGVALFNAIAQGVDVKAFLPLTLFREGNEFIVFVVRKDLVDDGKVRTVADLKGMKVVVNNVRGMTEYYTNEFLQSGGLTIDDVDLVVLPFPEMVQALGNKAVDAAFMMHPMAAVAVSPGENGEPPVGVELIKFSQAVESQQMAVMICGKNLLDPANRETAVRVTMGLIRAFRDLQGDAWRENDEIVAIISRYTGQPEEAVRRSVIPFYEPNGVINQASLIEMQRYYLERGYTDYQDALDTGSLIEVSFQEEALTRLGIVE